MLNLNIKNQNVIVLTTPRSGSTALSNRLAKDFNLKNYDEAFNSSIDQFPKNQNKLWESFDSGIKFICKIFPDHLITNENLNKLCNNSFVIFLYRENLIEQIASYHILITTNKPHYFKDEQNKEYQINLETTKLTFSIKNILLLRKQAFENYSQKATITLKYEDIVSNIENDQIKKYHHPSNYPELKSRIEKMLPIFVNNLKKLTK